MPTGLSCVPPDQGQKGRDGKRCTAIVAMRWKADALCSVARLNVLTRCRPQLSVRNGEMFFSFPEDSGRL